MEIPTKKSGAKPEVLNESGRRGSREGDNLLLNYCNSLSKLTDC